MDNRAFEMQPEGAARSWKGKDGPQREVWNRTGLDWFGLVWIGLDWFGLAWPNWAWVGLVWTGLNWFGLVWPNWA